MPTKTQNQYKRAAKTERLWMTLAKKEAISNLRTARRCHTLKDYVLEKFYLAEYKKDMQWYHYRKRIANGYIGKIGR
jgi:hypothetical protein